MQLKKINLTLALTIFALMGFSQAQLSLEDCRAHALKNSKNIKESEQQIAAARSKEKASTKDLYPTIDVNANFGYLQHALLIEHYDDDISYINEGSNLQYGLNVALMQNVYSGGLVRKHNALAKAQTELTVENSGLVTDMVLFQIENGYWDCVWNKEYVTLTNVYQQAVDGLVGVIKNKVDEGVSSRNDLLLIEVRQNEAKLFNLKAVDSYKISLMRLNRTIGFPIDSIIEVVDNLDKLSPFNYQSSIDSAYLKRPEVSSQEKMVEIQETQVQLTKARFMPSFNVGVVPFYGQPNYNLTDDGGLYNTKFIANLSMPIVRWGKKNDLVSEQSFLTEVEKITLADVKEQVTLEVKSALYALEEAANRVVLTKNSKLKAEENLQVMTDRYNEGLTSILEVLDAQVYWQVAYKDMLDAQRYYQYSLSSYKKSIGSI